MRPRARWSALLLSVGLLLLTGAPASAGHEEDPHTKNLHPLGHIVEPAVLGGFGGADPDIHSDIAFWGQLAIQGSWLGFDIRDISAPGNPRTISSTSCEGNQGDVVVWGDVVVRSWNTPAGTPGPFGAGLECDGEPVPPGFEGVHVFDISDLRDPVLVAAVETECGSHTATGVPDVENGRLLVYSNSSSSACPGFDVIEVPLDDPAGAQLLRSEPADRWCHDTGVILGSAMRAACAGADGFSVWSVGGTAGGSLENPEFLYSVSVPGVTIGHSAAFTWDGEVIVFGHEPGGGVQAECEAGDDPLKKSLLFFDAADGTLLGLWTLPRPQGPTENCTIHNFNVVPLRSGDHVVVSGNYQAGTWVTDFTDPANPRTLAWSDPAPVPTPPGSPFCCDVAGAWSSYWYNNFIYETNFGEGLNIFRYSGKETAGALRLSHLNPQTQETTLG